MKRTLRLMVVALMVALWPMAASAANLVVVETMSVPTSASGAVIPIKLTNDQSLRSIVMPLAIREVTPGSFITSMKMSFGDRLSPTGFLSQLMFTNQYANEDGSCKSGLPGGFGTITFADTLAHPVAASPFGMLFMRGRIFGGDLPAGADVTGSMLMTVDVTGVDGTFEIDTTCTNPANHPLFDFTDPGSVAPAFTPAVITIGTPPTNAPPVAICQDVTVDADGNCEAAVAPASVDNGSSDPDGDPITFALVPPGPYTLGGTAVQLIVTDDSGDADTCDATITVEDNAPPSITCPADVAVQCNADIPAPDIGSVTASDNCDPSPTITHEGDVADGQSCPGTITRTYRATDGSGNFAECTQTITVNDTEVPLITCPADVAVQCSADIPQPDIGSVTATDNCGSVTVTHEGDVSDAQSCPEIITRTYRATDDCGNFAECTQTITVNDTAVPLITCPADVAVQCSGDIPSPDIGSVTATDNCGSVTVTHEGDVSDGLSCPETITRTYRATDDCGNFAECTQTIAVNDTEAPVVTCPVDIVVSVPFGQTEAVVEFTASVSDNCSNATVSCDPPSGSSFPLGVTTVTCTGVDDCGNTGNCTFTVTVTEGSAPPVALCTDVTVSADANCEAGASIDNGSHDPDGGSVTLVQDPPGPYSLGQTLVSLYVTDDEGDADTCQGTVTVIDDTPPVASCPGDITVGTDPGQAGAIVNYSSSVSDNCPGATIDCVPPSGSFFPIGTTPVTCTATDASGNTDVCSFNVTVSEGNQPPVAECQDVTVDADVNCEADVSIDNGSFDPDGDPIMLTQDPPGPYPLGTTLVSLTVIDDQGLTDVCQGTVTVEDNSPPVVICPSDMVVAADSDQCGAVVRYTASASDNCGGGCVDVIWVIDGSGSMGDDQVAIANNADLFFQGLAGVDFRLGVMAYTDIANPISTDGVFMEGGPGVGQFTSDQGEFATMVTAVGDGGSGTENGLTALNNALEWYPFRPDCRKVIVLVTDEDADDFGSFDILVPPLLASGATIHTVFNFSDSTGYSTLAPSTGGAQFDITANWGPNVAALASEIFIEVVCDPPPGSFFPVGTTPVTCVATDASGNSGSCGFDITVEDTVGICLRHVSIDIKPGSCPNPLNVKFKGGTMITSAGVGNPTGAGGALPVAILGSADFDVTTIDPASVMLEGVGALRTNVDDVASPVVDGEECECTTDRSDGFADLLLKFTKSAIIAAIEPVSNGDELALTLTGTLLDGTPFAGSDCVLIRAMKPSFPNTIQLAAGAEGGIATWNQPNPFNAGTTINYLMGEGGHVNLTVYNILGQEVATLVNSEQEAGRYSTVWDGRNASGAKVSSGMYLYRLQVGSETVTRKMLLLR
jgi:hypothetical protein